MAISDALGERRTADVSAGRLEYRVRGEGPPVVFAHGAGVNADLWRHVVPRVAEDHRCIAPDLPLGGHAVALNGNHDGSLYGQAQILDDLLGALDLDEVALVGNDTGGAICQALVGRWPTRVARLALTSCDAFRNYPPRAVAYLKPTSYVPPALWLLTTQAMRFRAVQRAPIAYGWATREPIEPAIVDSFLRGLRTDAGVRRDFARLLRDADRDDMQRATESLATFDRPATVIWAADDKFFPIGHGRRMAELLSQGRFELIESSRTFIPIDQPDALVAALRAFLLRS